MKYRCPCCGFYTFEERPNGNYDICDVCFWEDDLIQMENETYEGGANRVSLVQAQKNFIEFGFCASQYRRIVFLPTGMVKFTLFRK